MELRRADLHDPQVAALLELHLAGMHENSPPGTCFALDTTGLQAADITFVAAWSDEALLGFGALRELSPQRGEIKSMRTAPAHLGMGVGAAVLDHLLDLARARSYRTVCLETGSGAAFEPAIALYRRYGFTACEPFGDYLPTDFNQFMQLAL